MKFLIATVLFLGLVGLASADPRIETRECGGIVHFPNGTTELHDVTYSTNGNPHVIVKDGIAHGSAQWNIKTAYNQHHFDYGTTLIRNEDTSGWPCTMVDGGGRTWIAETWRAYVTAKKISEDTDQLYFTFRCFNGVQQ